MAVITFVASSLLATGYTSGVEYSIYFECAAHELDIKPITEDSVSLSGIRETVIHRRERTWDVTTGAMIGLAADQFACFLASVQDGSEFTFDRFATLDSEGAVVADRPVVCELANDGRRKRLGNRLDAFQFDFKIREVAGATVPLYGENFYWDLDLTTGVVPDGWTYTRTGDLYALRPDGIYHRYSPNVMASHYDLIAGVELGSWFGPAVSNQILYSSDISNSVWLVSSVTKSSAISVIEEGVAQKITNTASNGALIQDVGTFGAEPETMDAIFEQGNNATGLVGIYDTTAATYVHQARIDYSSGAITNTAGTGTSVNVRAFKTHALGPNGGAVWRLLITYTPPVAGNSRRIYLKPQGTVSAAGQYGYVHHSQLQAGAGITPYWAPVIVTGAAPVSRGADLLKCESLPGWINKREYTLGAVVRSVEAMPQPSTWVLTVSDGTNSNYLALLQTSTPSPRANCQANGVASFSQFQSVTHPARYRYAARFKKDDFALSVNGANPAVDTAGDLPAVVSKANIGSAYSDSAQAGGFIERAMIAAKAYSDAELQNWAA